MADRQTCWSDRLQQRSLNSTTSNLFKGTYCVNMYLFVYIDVIKGHVKERQKEKKQGQEVQTQKEKRVLRKVSEGKAM